MKTFKRLLQKSLKLPLRASSVCLKGKMRHLLEVLCKDFKEPINAATGATDLEKNENGPLDAFHSHLGSGDTQLKTKESTDPFSYASLINRCDSPDYAVPLFASTPSCSPERTASPSQTTEKKDEEDDKVEKGLSSPQGSDRFSSHMRGSAEEVHQNQTDATAASEVSIENHERSSVTSDKDFHEELGGGDFERHHEQFEDLGTKLYEMHLEASKTDDSDMENKEEHTAASVSDDDF